MRDLIVDVFEAIQTSLRFATKSLAELCCTQSSFWGADIHFHPPKVILATTTTTTDRSLQINITTSMQEPAL